MMNDGTIRLLLSKRHKKDLVVQECPTSTAYAAGYGQIDFWAMRKSWANPMVTGYEIKVSRSDFLRDDKWRKYLKYCDVFFFAAPPGIIKPDELPPEAGLIEATKNGAMMRVKKKAPLRETDPKCMAKVYKAVLMNRALIGDPQTRPMSKRERMDEWSLYVADRRNLAFRVSKAIRNMVTEARKERDKAVAERRALDGFAVKLRNLGVDPEEPFYAGTKKIDRALRDEGIEALKRAHRELGDIIKGAGYESIAE